MTRFRRKPWLLVLPILAVCLAPAVCFMQSFTHSNFFSIRLRSSGQEDGGRPTLCPSYDFYKFACEAANQTGLEVEQYLSNVARLQDGFIKSKEMVDRSDFLKALRDAMLSQKFTVILGGKNLGKTLIRNRTIRQLENEGANLTIIDVNMREHPSKELFTAILERVARKNSDWASNLLRILKKRAPDRAAAIASAVLMVTQDDVPALVRMLSHIEKEEILLDMMTTAFKGNATCIVIDEANLALPVTGSESIHSQRALQYFVMLSKEQGIASVVLISSELGYSFRLRECGMNLQDIQNIVVANEVPKKEMLKLMVNRWNMSIDLAEEFFTYCGGNIDLCCRGVDQLQRLGDQFDPCILADCPGLPSCASDPDAKKHLQNLAKQGFSPVYDVETDHAAKLIAEKNVGGIIPKRASAFNLPEGIWEGNHENALVPSGTLMTLKIANELERVNRMGASSSGFTSTSPSVWVRQLRKGNRPGAFEFTGNAFKVSAVSDIDDLKKAVKAQKPNKVKCDADELDIFSQQDVAWKKEDEDAELYRGTSKSDCYGYLLPD